jgi:hypothetical protein
MLFLLQNISSINFKNTVGAMRAISLFCMLMVACTLAQARTPRADSGDEAQILANCPTEGDAKAADARQLNLLKRRMMSPSDLDSKVTLQAILAPGDDTRRWNEQHGAAISGYVADVKVGGIESVNCHTKDPLYRDTHIELTLDPLNDSEAKHVIVEVTPQWRQVMAKDGVDWSTATLRKTLLGRWIRVTGWLMFDVEHARQSTNTASGSGKVWRATAWEVHPITKIEVLPGKPRS